MCRLRDYIRNKLYAASRDGRPEVKDKAIQDVLYMIAREEESERLKFDYLERKG
jgi:hypothetical protein